MRDTTSVYEPDGVQEILEFVDELKEIAYTYAYAPDLSAKAAALRNWQTATVRLGLEAGPKERHRRFECRRSARCSQVG